MCMACHSACMGMYMYVGKSLLHVVHGAGLVCGTMQLHKNVCGSMQTYAVA